MSHAKCLELGYAIFKMARRGRRSKQLEMDLRPRTHGGARAGAGRKARPAGQRRIAHVTRPVHTRSNPVHVTTRAVALAPSFRTQRVLALFQALFARASEKGFRLLHFSVQSNHLHLIVEATDVTALARGVQRLLSRIAQQLNAMVGRHGKLWRERYHRHDLATPSEVRRALVYVLNNHLKHLARVSGVALVDPFSSARWFDGFSGVAVQYARGSPSAAGGIAPVVAPRTWLARIGWRRRGLVRVGEAPSSAG